MSDNLKRYCAILVALKQHYPSEPTGNLARHLCTLAALISGIVGSKKCHLPAIASKLPTSCSPQGAKKRESRIKRLARFVQNKAVTPEAFFAPYAQALVESLPAGPLVLIMDGSQVGRGCMALMMSVLYQQGDKKRALPLCCKKRALPLCWRVVKAKKGHFSEQSHRQLLAQAKRLLPSHRTVIFLGDGEFDGPELLADVQRAGWQFVCRTAKNALLCEADWPGETFALSDVMADGWLRPGESIELPDLLFTAQGLGPVLVAAVWERGQCWWQRFGSGAKKNPCFWSAAWTF